MTGSQPGDPGLPVVIRMRPLGAIVGAIHPNDFPRQANGYGQVGGDHASLRPIRTTLNSLTGI
jgi:hypothetical protein